MRGGRLGSVIAVSILRFLCGLIGGCVALESVSRLLFVA